MHLHHVCIKIGCWDQPALVTSLPVGNKAKHGKHLTVIGSGERHTLGQSIDQLVFICLDKDTIGRPIVYLIYMIRLEVFYFCPDTVQLRYFGYFLRRKHQSHPKHLQSCRSEAIYPEPCFCVPHHLAKDILDYPQHGSCGLCSEHP